MYLHHPVLYVELEYSTITHEKLEQRSSAPRNKAIILQRSAIRAIFPSALRAPALLYQRSALQNPLDGPLFLFSCYVTFLPEGKVIQIFIGKPLGRGEPLPK